MSNENVWPAMAETFEAKNGDLADRMLAAWRRRKPRVATSADVSLLPLSW